MKKLLLLLFCSVSLSAICQAPSCPSLARITKDVPIYSTPAYTIYPKGLVWDSIIVESFGDTAVSSSFENRSWKLTKELSQYPSLQSDYPILNALYNMTVEELDNLIEQDSTWRTGKWWGGVWTRDVSYSTILAAAYMQPDVTRISLLKKVSKGRIIEDTGTGGSWPVSTDRIVWTLAAWQLYLVTGNSQWLRESFSIIDNTLRQDYLTVRDSLTGLYRGESTFLDWREETYPRWMEPADISQSECLGTNALYFQAFNIAASMASLLGNTDSQHWYQQRAVELSAAINTHLWLPDKGYYAQYLYGGPFKIASPRSETLGESLCLLYGISPSESHSQQILQSVPLNPLGTSCISPQIPNIYPYHNNAVWPFVQAFWMRASSLHGNTASLNHSIGAILRAASVFATNQENFVVTTGDYHTAMNSPNMLWSINGHLSIVHSIFAGIRPGIDSLSFSPFVPKEWTGTYRISHFKIRKADLDIIVEGYGTGLNNLSRKGRHTPEIYLDGRLIGTPAIAYSKLKGHHTIRLVLNQKESEPQPANFTPVQTSPETVPEVYLSGTHTLAWRQVPNVHHYKILRNGVLFATQPERIINDNHIEIPLPDTYSEYQVIAVDSMGHESFATKPLPYYDLDNQLLIDLSTCATPTRFAPCKGWSGNGAVEIAAGVNDYLLIQVEAPTEGEYLLDFRYANGSGDLFGYNMCCNRTLSVNGRKVTQMVFPQRGQDLWQLWGWSNKATVSLHKGTNHILLSYGPENLNMNDKEVNRCLLDQLRLIRL